MSKAYICDKCGLSEDEEHIFENNVCSVCGYRRSSVEETATPTDVPVSNTEEYSFVEIPDTGSEEIAVIVMFCASLIPVISKIRIKKRCKS